MENPREIYLSTAWGSSYDWLMRCVDYFLLNCIVGVDKHGGKRNGYSNLNQTFQVKFNEFAFHFDCVKLNRSFMDSLRSRLMIDPDC